jgi:hypothetical protein
LGNAVSCFLLQTGLESSLSQAKLLPVTSGFGGHQIHHILPLFHGRMWPGCQITELLEAGLWCPGRWVSQRCVRGVSPARTVCCFWPRQAICGEHREEDKEMGR